MEARESNGACGEPPRAGSAPNFNPMLPTLNAGNQVFFCLFLTTRSIHEEHIALTDTLTFKRTVLYLYIRQGVDKLS